MVNLDKIKAELGRRASMCKKPESSKFHHGNGPFYIKCDTESIGVYNKNEKEVVIFPYDRFGLPTGEFKFDLTDSFTHDTLCNLNLFRLVGKLSAMKDGVGPIAVLADPKNAPFLFDKAGEGLITLSSSMGIVATINLAELSAPAQEPASSTKIRFGTTDTRNYNKDDTPAAASKNSFGPLGDSMDVDADRKSRAEDGGESGKVTAATELSGKTPSPKESTSDKDTGSKPKSTTPKSVDEMSKEEFEEELSKASQESEPKKKGRSRRRSRHQMAKDKAQAKSSDYDSKEGAGSNDSKSAEEMYDESDGEPSDLSGDESGDDLKQAKPKPGEEGIHISAKSFGGAGETGDSSAAATETPAKSDPVNFGNESDKNQWADDGSVSSSASLDKVVERLNLVDKVPLTPGHSVGDTATTDMSTITGVTDPSEIFPNQEGKYLFSFTIKLVPNRKHKEVLVEKTKVIFSYLKSVCPDIVMLPATQSASGGRDG